MFSTMRRSERALSREQTIAILQTSNVCVLAMVDASERPYAVPINYAWIDGKLIFHSAVEGRKMRALRANPDVCVVVVPRAEIVPEKLTTAYASAVVFGRARVVDDQEEKRALILRMTDAMSKPDPASPRALKCADDVERYAIVEIVPEFASGKANTPTTA